MTRSDGILESVRAPAALPDRGLITFLLSQSRSVVFHFTPMLPGIPAVLFMAVTQTLPKAGVSSDPASERMAAGAPGMPPEKITRGVVEDVRFFRGESERSDDISVMTIRARTLKETIF
jgi:hypothetical protein